MLISQLVSSHGHPNVHDFVVRVLDMQFSDVRAMLQLPRPDIGITPACNFAIVSSLCNLISGISTTIYKPPDLLHEARSKCGSGEAFRGLVAGYFPYAPPGAAAEFPKQLYDLCRNPMAHSAGLRDAPNPVVFFARVLDSAHPDVGWSDQELEDLERPERPYGFQVPGIVVDSTRWTLNCDPFYLEVIDMLRRLVADSSQMQAAESRFAKGVSNWRR